MKTDVIKIIELPDLQSAWTIRKEVFVVEQNCPEELEWEYEEESVHYLAKVNGIAAGTARWRKTDKGIKFERFAVLKEYRKQGVGQALVKKLLEEVQGSNCNLYLHAQIQAASLYSKFGFEPKGERFMEADILHIKMERPSD